MLITQLYRSGSSLNDVGLEILQKWNNQTNTEKQANVAWIAEQMRSDVNGKFLAIALALKLGVSLSPHFPPPSRP